MVLQKLSSTLPENKALVELFEMVLRDVLEALVVADDQTTINRLQGKASVLKEFLIAVEESQGVLERR